MSVRDVIQAAAGASSGPANYIEDVFSTYLYTGNGSTQTITNGIDLAGNGGATWIKVRDLAGEEPTLFNTATQYGIGTNTTSYNTRDKSLFWNVTSSGFTIPSGSGGNPVINQSGKNYASWTFRKQPKFFDVVTWTGDGSFPRTITHNLGSTPGCIIFKATNAVDNWYVYHRGLTAGNKLQLDSTGAQASAGGYNTTVTSTSFSPAYNSAGTTYVAYLFAHNAGGFGLTGTDNVISCGSFTTDASGNATVNLGYEPQWLLIKGSSIADSWYLGDVMRGMSQTNLATLLANSAGAESNVTSNLFKPTSTGFQYVAGNTSATHIYIAIRRPNKPPTTGTQVYNAVISTTLNDVYGSLAYPDFGLYKESAAATNWLVCDRLRGLTGIYNPQLSTNTTSAETTPVSGDTVTVSSTVVTNSSNVAFFGGTGATTSKPLGYSFKRAPGFFDVVCYTGTGSALTLSHNLGVAPELIIVKQRSSTSAWWTWCRSNSLLAGTSSTTSCVLSLNTTDYNGSGSYAESVYFPSLATTTGFSVYGANAGDNATGQTYVAYLFASCPGVSKVGSYTGNGSTQTINCGFTGGARFVLIKRTDSTGDWYVYDTARGITTLTDPYLLLNSTAAESATLGSVTTVSGGFAVNAAILAAINTNAATYIYLAIA